MTLNLKRFDEFFKFKHSKLESIEDALDPITKSCYSRSANVTDTY